MDDSSFPQWTTEITDNVVPGEDMLGIEGAAQSYQQWLIPGITTATNHARYYSFYAWVLYRFINSSRGKGLLKNFRGKFFRRHEVAFILGSYSHHMDGELIRSLTGAGNSYNKVISWWKTSDPVSLDVNYFKNKLGGLGQYYFTVMQSLGIIGESEYATWVFPLTHRGEEIAKAYGASISKTNYFKKIEEHDELDELSHKDAKNLGKTGCLCAESLAEGDDLNLLRDAFFRFDQHGTDNPHVRRRLALGVILDLVRGAGGKFERDMLRTSLYLGEYSANLNYKPSPQLEDWAFRWKMVAVRHQYTLGLQNLWGAFILCLREQNGGLSLGEYMAWIEKTIGEKPFNSLLGDYLNSLCKDVGLSANWQKSHKEFSSACLQKTEIDEYSLFIRARNDPQDAEVLLATGAQILAQHYLRFLHQHQFPRPEWKELTDRERLPITSFYEFVGESLTANMTLGSWLENLYKEYVLSQHEYIALGKLRYQNYDTLKFHYREGRFYWPFKRSDYWREPIRLAANRLGNALSILFDLGMVEENEDGQFSLAKDGDTFLARIIELRRYDN